MSRVALYSPTVEAMDRLKSITDKTAFFITNLSFKNLCTTTRNTMKINRFKNLTGTEYLGA